jgi:hypothetical protein
MTAINQSTFPNVENPFGRLAKPRLGRLAAEEPGGECPEDKSDLGRKGQVGGHADEDAESDADDRSDTD